MVVALSDIPQICYRATHGKGFVTVALPSPPAVRRVLDGTSGNKGERVNVSTARAMGALALAVALVAGCSVLGSEDDTSPAALPPSTSPMGLPAYYQQKPAWKACDGGFQCTRIAVPLDYAKPEGPQIKLAVLRQPATTPSARIGSLVVNPGGPGSSGVNFVRQAGKRFGPQVQARYDIVGFDPRGVGASDPVRCMDGPQLDRYFSIDLTPDDKGERDALTKAGQDFAEACKGRTGRLLPYIGTLNAARDIDVLRAVLGDEKLNYAGFSYGTYLGAVYAEQFPRNTRVLLLDAAVDPKLSATGLLAEQAKGFETALRSFAADCLKLSDCALRPGSVDDALDKIAGLMRKADRTPLKSARRDPREINENWVTFGIETALYDKGFWPALRQALGAALKSSQGDLLLTLADQMYERQPDGSYSNLMEAYTAVTCVDKPQPPSAGAMEKEAGKAGRAAPRFGTSIMWTGLPCVYWPVRATSPPKEITAAGAAPILVVGTTRDPATPYSGARALAGQLQSGVLLTYEGDGHGAYLTGSPCVAEAVDRYLLTATPPKDGTVCR